MKPNFTLYINLFCFTATLFFSCNAKKSTVISRGVQNLTAKYNYLYNAKVQLQHYEAQLQHAFPFQHQQLLPLYLSPQNQTADSKELNQVIARAQLIISKKSYSNYIADSYLLMAKANYLKGNYFLAEAYYHYVAKNYAQHLLLYTEALSGEARCAMQLDKPEAATPTIEVLEAKLPLLKKPKTAILLTLAQYYIATQQHPQAIALLEQAVATHPKARQMDISHYVLGQLYEIQKNYTLALQHYASIKNPPSSSFSNSIQQRTATPITIYQYSTPDPDAALVDTTGRSPMNKTDESEQKKRL